VVSALEDKAIFCDKVTVNIKAGNGGDGIVSFLHEKYREFGGPDGGDGGKGGSVILVADDSQNTLYYYKTHHKIEAKSGDRGKGRRKHGKNGEDLIIKVPQGTVIINEDTGKLIADLANDSEVVVAKGGDGGYGNAHFTSSTRQSPRISELGEPGEELNVTLEMKMIADVGLVGLPNVGKSTLLSVISAAKPKIANYEFTTLIPNLGVVEEGTFEVGSGFIAADIPGIIEGASEGKGLGIEFLKHIERTRLLVHILDVTHLDLAADYKTIRNELNHYSVNLSERPEIIAVNKIDSVPPEVLAEKLKTLKKVLPKGTLVHEISAVAHLNLKPLLHAIELDLAKIPKTVIADDEEPETKIFTIEDVLQQNHFTVIKKKKSYELTGPKIERFAVRTDFSNPFGVARFRDILKKQGIDKELKRAGAKEGDKIKVNGKEFIF
jgi:GTPase